MRRDLWIFVGVLASFAIWGVRASAQDAPFGLTWGRQAKVPRPTFVEREGNITALIYLHDQLPPDLTYTEALVLEVCDSEGLQRMVWLSRDLSQAEARHKYAEIVAQGTRQFGEPEPDRAGAGAIWLKGRSTVALGPGASGKDRMFMTSAGPEFDACSNEHLAITGHPATEHNAHMWAAPR